MLIPRIITGTILAIIAICAVLFLPITAFLYVSAGLFLLGAWEWTAIMQIKTPVKRGLYLVLLAILMGLSYQFFPITIMLLITLIWWVIGLVLVIIYPRGSELFNKHLWIYGVIGYLVLVPAWLSMNVIRMAVSGPYILLFVLAVIWASDIGAYFVGRKWGQHKLAPKVSPGKSWQGLIGGIVVSLIVAIIGCRLLNLPVNQYWIGGLICLIMVLFGVVGDLVESLFKRQAGIKDSGNWLPGHGGILDRIDSLLAAIPVFLLCSLLLSL